MPYNAVREAEHLCASRIVMQAAAFSGKKATVQRRGRSCMGGPLTLCGLKATGPRVNLPLSSFR